MKLKKAAAALLAALLLAVPRLPACAEEWAAEDFSLTVPEEFVYSFNQDTSADDPSWALAGVSDPASQLSLYREMGTLASFYTEDGKTNVVVMWQQNDTSQSVYSLKDATDQEREKFLESLGKANLEGMTLTKEYRDINGVPFYCVRVDSDVEGGKVHDRTCGTIVNGYSLVIEMYNGENAITQEQEALYDSLLNSARITNIREKPEPDPVSIVPTLIMVFLLLAMVIVPFIYIPLRNRRDKKQKAKMAERLSQYRKIWGDNNDLGEIRFVNATDCTKEAIHAFSVYQAYGKGLGSLILGGLMCVLLLIAAFGLNAEWWLKLLAVGMAAYFVYKFVSLPNSIERIQLKVFQRGVSETARYAFYDRAFRVTGIQSGNVYPYFQITAVRRHGHYLYLYYGPENAYLVDQYGFELGEFEEFEKFIREKAGKEG